MTFDDYWVSEMKAVGATNYKRESLFYVLAKRAWDAARNAAKKSEQAAWYAGLDAGREQGRGEDRFVSELELLEALKMARAELAGLPRSLGYDLTHLPKIDAVIAKHCGHDG